MWFILQRSSCEHDGVRSGTWGQSVSYRLVKIINFNGNWILIAKRSTRSKHKHDIVFLWLLWVAIEKKKYQILSHGTSRSDQLQMLYITTEMYLSDLSCQVLSLKILLMACESLNGFLFSFHFPLASRRFVTHFWPYIQHFMRAFFINQYRISAIWAAKAQRD